MQETGSVLFYRQQAARLSFLAADTINAATRLELLEIPASFLKLADYAATNSDYAAEEPMRRSA